MQGCNPAAWCIFCCQHLCKSTSCFRTSLIYISQDALFGFVTDICVWLQLGLPRRNGFQEPMLLCASLRNILFIPQGQGTVFEIIKKHTIAVRAFLPYGITRRFCIRESNPSPMLLKHVLPWAIANINLRNYFRHPDDYQSPVKSVLLSASLKARSYYGNMGYNSQSVIKGGTASPKLTFSLLQKGIRFSTPHHFCTPCFVTKVYSKIFQTSRKKSCELKKHRWFSYYFAEIPVKRAFFGTPNMI